MAILRHPYDPNLWLQRARTLTDLRYPELAVGDAHKAILLCTQILDSLQRRPRFRTGHGWGFYMLDLQIVDDAGQSNERDWQYDRVASLNCQAHSVREENLYHSPSFEEGRFVAQPYPWMLEKWLSRSDELVDLLNLELLTAGKLDGREPACTVQQ